MATPKIILLNGPKRVGKDTAARIIARTFAGAVHLKMATPVADPIPYMFGISPAEWTVMREATKDEPSEYLYGMTPREAMIWVSENVMKPKFGKQVYGEIACRRLHALCLSDPTAAIVVFSDSGFRSEAEPVIAQFGAENVLLLRLHRPNHTFAGDSRSHIDLTDLGVRAFDLHNTDSKQTFERCVVRTVYHLLEKPELREPLFGLT